MHGATDDYKGLDNRDLKLRNLEDWQIPGSVRNPKVRMIMGHLSKMKPGESVKMEGATPQQATLLRSAVWRLVKRREMGIIVRKVGGDLYFRKEEA